MLTKDQVSFAAQVVSCLFMRNEARVIAECDKIAMDQAAIMNVRSLPATEALLEARANWLGAYVKDILDSQQHPQDIN